MNKTVYILAELYNKIAKGTATDTEKAIYKYKFAISCIDAEVLLKAIQETAREIEKDN